MPDYIYLLENRLSTDQKSALTHLREAARHAEMLLFLTGDAVRDLTSGHAVRDIEVAVAGNALDLKESLEKTPVQIWGEDPGSQSLYLCFPGTVRVDVVSTHRTEYPKPGHPIFHPSSIQEDLRSRDFTVNAMALSLNEGSYGLLMDPLNGAADIEARSLRLVSNYGFLEEPALLIRATRYEARLGWALESRTKVRYDNAKAEGVIEYLSAHERSRELEQIGHEDDGLKVLQALENEGWLRALSTQWTPAKADEERLKALHNLAVDLLLQGVHADVSAAQMQLLTAKMAPKDLGALKKQLLRPGFVAEWNNLDAIAAGFAKVLLAKDNQTPSASFRLFMSYDPEAVLWLGFTAKETAVKELYNNFLKVWPEMRQRIPHAQMQEMRIKPELPNYNQIVQAIFLELIDGKLTTPEEMQAFLEPFSPPAPPPQITIKRTRAKRGESRVKEFEEEEGEEGLEGEEDLDEMGGDEEEIGLEMPIPKVDLEPDEEGEAEEEEEGEFEDGGEDEEEEETPAAKRGAKAADRTKTAAAPPAKPGKLAIPLKAAAAKAPVPRSAKPEPGAKQGAKSETAVNVAPPPKPKPAPPAKKQAPAKSPAKVEAKKAPAKHPVKATAKHAPAKSHAVAKGAVKHVSSSKAHKPAKPAGKKPAAKKR